MTMDPIEETSIALMEESAIATHHQLLDIMMDESRTDDHDNNNNNNNNKSNDIYEEEEEDSGILDRATCMSVEEDDDENYNETVLRAVISSNKHKSNKQIPQFSKRKFLAAPPPPTTATQEIAYSHGITTKSSIAMMTPQHKPKQSSAYHTSATLVSPLTVADDDDNDNDHASSSSSSPSAVSTSPTSIMTPVGMTSICDMSSIAGGNTTVHGDIVLMERNHHCLVSPSSTHVDELLLDPPLSFRQHPLRKKEAAKAILLDEGTTAEEDGEHEVAPEALLKRLQLNDEDDDKDHRQMIVSPSRSNTSQQGKDSNHPKSSIGHHRAYINIQQPDHKQDEGLISKRLQDIEFKKLALHRKRISLEQRLFDFVDSEKRMRVMMGSPFSSPGSSAASMYNFNHNNNQSLNGTSLNHSLQSTQSLLLQPPTPSPHKRLMHSKHNHIHQRSPNNNCMHPHQNGDQMVLDYPWHDPRAAKNNNNNNNNSDNANDEKGIAYYYTGPLNKIKQPHGVGTMRFLDGQEYEGQVYAGYRWGMGTNRWPDGQIYFGEWEDHSRNGRGTHTWKDGRRVTGQWSGGHLNGRVIFSWPNGASYDGECRMGKKHGRGTHTWANGRLYTGNFENGKEHGFGSLTQSDCRYRGNFEKGKRCGIGMQIWRNKTYDGEWKNNKADGKGRIVWQNGATYTGEFTAGKYHGLGGMLFYSSTMVDVLV